jgi:8-oxo-dGTP pyrophosphatase MutT (NUDIX family)
LLTPSPASRQPASLTASIPNFDPRQVPVIGTDSHLPAVPAAGQTPQALRARFAHPPRWQPEVRKEARFAPRTPAHAAVLVPLVLREELTVLLTQRTEQLSTHSGQVAFPGGRQDPEDADATATALREAQEEVGLDPGQVEVLGSLPVYETGTAFMVTPVVALVQPDAPLHPNPYEVADVFEVPLRFLLDPAHHQRHRLHWQGLEREWFSMPYLDGGRERYIWGATAGMLRNFYRFMVA